MPSEDRVQLGKLGMSDSYAYTFRASGRLMDGSHVERWVTVTSPKLVPWGQVEGDAANFFDSEYTVGWLTVTGITHQEILRRPVFAPV